MYICPKCGIENPKDSESCQRCGAKVARLQEQSRERQLSELSAKVLGWDDDHPVDGIADLSLDETKQRRSRYPAARLLSGLLYCMAVLLVIATGVAAVWTWNLLIHINSLFTWPVPATELAGATDIFTLWDMVCLVVLEILAGLVFAALVAAAASGLNLGRAMALDAHFAKEYLARHLPGTEASRQGPTSGTPRPRG